MYYGGRRRPKRKPSSSPDNLDETHSPLIVGVGSDDTAAPAEGRRRKMAVTESLNKESAASEAVTSSPTPSSSVRGDKSRFTRFREVFRKRRKSASSNIQTDVSFLAHMPCTVEVPLEHRRADGISKAESSKETVTSSDAEASDATKDTGRTPSAKVSRRGQDTHTPPLPIDLALSPRLLTEMPSLSPPSPGLTVTSARPPSGPTPLPPLSGSFAPIPAKACLDCTSLCPHSSFPLPPVAD